MIKDLFPIKLFMIYIIKYFFQERRKKKNTILRKKLNKNRTNSKMNDLTKSIICIYSLLKILYVSYLLLF
jgi:hypothetical protein